VGDDFYPWASIGQFPVISMRSSFSLLFIFWIHWGYRHQQWPPSKVHSLRLSHTSPRSWERNTGSFILRKTLGPLIDTTNLIYCIFKNNSTQSWGTSQDTVLSKHTIARWYT
jgi:hypothetical protein